MNTKRKKTGRKLLSFLLALAMVVGLLPGMGLTAYAASTTVTWNASDIVPENPWDKSFTKEGITITAATCDFEQLTFGGGGTFTTTLGNFTKIEISADYAGDVSGTGWSNDGWQSATWTGDAASVSFSGDIWGGGMTCDGGNLTIKFTIEVSTVDVTGVTLNPSAAQTIEVDGKVSFTATVSPDNATDKKVKWSVGGTDAGAVKLYTDESCATEVSTDATETLTVYAKGESAGSATVTCTSNADSEKKASCDVTVNAAQTQTETLLTTITAVGASNATTATSANVSYSVEGVATLMFSGLVSYQASPAWGWWGYGWTATVAPSNGYTITKCIFYDDANRTATDSSSPFVVETTEEDKTPRVNGNPILANTSKGITMIKVYGYATPASSYSVTITPGDHMTKTADSGDAEQTGLTGAMADVVYTADDGYYFPTDYSVAEVSGIEVTRDSYTQITVSGTPTADAAITLTAPTAKTTPDAPTAAATDCTTADNNDGTLTGVTTAMEYKKSDAADWTAGTDSDITGLAPGTYYVRVKATETTLASDNQELTIKGFISYTVTFKVVNGKWNDETTADKTVTLTGYEGDTLKLAANQIPAVGTKPNDTYKAGSWDTTPSADTEITADTTYTYTYAQKDSISQTVTFKVVNGSWNDKTTTDKTVTLTGYEGDTLKLTADQIPAVGTKPNDTYKAGSWDTTPSADTEITADTTYTYTYAQKDSISQTVTFKVVNGSWNDKTTADKTVTLTGYEGDTLKLAADQIPAVGTKPNDTYKAGSWDVTPSTETEIMAATTYTYTYAQKDSISQTVTFKVVNGSWNDETRTDKTVTLTGYEGDTLKLMADQIPTVGTKPNDTYKAGSWDVMPNTDTAITEATTYTYTYVAKEASVVTKAPEAKTLTYNGQAQELVTAGTATGGEMQYALGDANGATQPYTTDIPARTDVGTYYVWYKVIGDANHNDSEAGFVEAKINPVDKTDLNKAIEEAEAYYNTIKDNSDYSEQKEALGSAISTAKSLAKNDNVTAAEVSEGITAINTAETAVEGITESNKETFAAEKTTQKNNADALAKDGDSDASKKLIEDAKKVIDELAYDETKSLDENKAALAVIVSKLKDDLTAKRAAEKRAAEDKAAAEKKAAEEKAARELAAAKQEAQAAMNEQLTVTQKGNKFTVKWKKSSSADGYYVYAQYCGKKITKPIKTIKKNTTTKTTIKKINGKKISTKKNFRVYVVPYKIINGKKVKLGKSTVAHLVGAKNKKYSNVKKLTLKKKKYSVKVGKKKKIKAKITLVSKNKKHISKSHGAKFRYKSSDTSIATVSKKGKIKGIKKGTCTIYVYSINGLMKKAKVTIK